MTSPLLKNRITQSLDKNWGSTMGYPQGEQRSTYRKIKQIKRNLTVQTGMFLLFSIYPFFT
jgi:hypothetical protein